MRLDTKRIKVIAFDADDTLWENEDFFRDAEQQFYDLMRNFSNSDSLEKELFKTEIGQISLYGYGIKGFILSMIETAINESNHKVPLEVIDKIIQLGKQMLQHPVCLLKGSEQILTFLSKQNYRIIVATKGDLLDQERKLRESGLSKYFHHIEVMTDKKEPNYQTLLSRLNIEASQLLMIGNSLKSDILPVLRLGGQAVYIPYHTTWIHEELNTKDLKSYTYFSLKSLDELEHLLV